MFAFAFGLVELRGLVGEMARLYGRVEVWLIALAAGGRPALAPSVLGRAFEAQAG